MTSWLFGVIGNLNRLDADGHFAWTHRDTVRDLTSFTWKGQTATVEWYRRIPLRAVKEVEKLFDELWEWVGKGWRPTAAIERIDTGFDPSSINPFNEPPNGETSFLERPDLKALSDLLINQLAQGSRLVLVYNERVVLNEATYTEFHRRVTKLVKVNDLLYYKKSLY